MPHLTRRIDTLRNLLQPVVQGLMRGGSRNGVLRRCAPFVVGGELSMSAGWRSAIEALTCSFEHVGDCFEDPLQAVLAAPYPSFDPCDRGRKKILRFIKPGMSRLFGSVRANVVAALVQIISGDPSDDGLVEPFLETESCTAGGFLRQAPSFGTHARLPPRRALVHGINRPWRLRFTTPAAAEFLSGMVKKRLIRLPASLAERIGLHIMFLQLVIANLRADGHIGLGSRNGARIGKARTLRRRRKEMS
jgi:hypothetical protein